MLQKTAEKKREGGLEGNLTGNSKRSASFRGLLYWESGTEGG